MRTKQNRYPLTTTLRDYRPFDSRHPLVKAREIMECPNMKGSGTIRTEKHLLLTSPSAAASTSAADKICRPEVRSLSVLITVHLPIQGDIGSLVTIQSRLLQRR